MKKEKEKLYLLSDIKFFISPFNLTEKTEINKIFVIPFLCNKDNTKIKDFTDNQVIKISENALDTYYNSSKINDKINKALSEKYCCETNNTQITTIYDSIQRLLTTNYLIFSERVEKYDGMINNTIDGIKDRSEIKVAEKQIKKLAKILKKYKIEIVIDLKKEAKCSTIKISQDSKDF